MTLTDVRPSPTVEPPQDTLIEDARRRTRQRRIVITLMLLAAAAGLVAIASGGSASQRFEPRNGPFASGGIATGPAREHTATSTLYVASRNIVVDSDPRSGHTRAADAGFDRLVATFVAMIDSRHMVAKAVKSSKIGRSINEVARATEARVIPETKLIEVSVSDRDPRTAVRLSNAISHAFEREANELRPSGTDRLVSLVELAKLDR